MTSTEISIPQSSPSCDVNVLLDESLNIVVNTRVSYACLGGGTDLQLLGNSTNDFTDLLSVLEGDESGHLERVSASQPRA